jgi:diguanylate cyclase (GGDEF)-like protein
MVNAMPLSLQKLKYKFYAFLLPIFLIVASLGWYDESRLPNPDPVNLIILPVLVGLYIFSFYVVYLKRDWIERAEKFMIVAICFVAAVKFTYVVTFELEQTMSLGPFTFWMPLFYMFLFLLLNIRWALITIAVTYIWFLCVALYNLPDLAGTPAVSTLIQYMLANLVFITTLFFLQTVKKTYIKAEVLEELANTDYLTGLPNRRKIDKELLRAIKAQKKLSIIYLDIDHFKQINDSYGHSTGDLVLKEFTEITEKRLDKSGILGRWGGEEFMMIIKNKDVKEAEKFAEEIREHISEHPFSIIGNLTASFGVTELKSSDTLDSLLNRADKALYEAKNSGRNLVLTYSRI